jgi:hypothetical protein
MTLEAQRSESPDIKNFRWTIALAQAYRHWHSHSAHTTTGRRTAQVSEVWRLEI